MIVAIAFIFIVQIAADMQFAMAIEDSQGVILQLSREIEIWLYDRFHVTGEIGGETTGTIEPPLEHA